MEFTFYYPLPVGQRRAPAAGLIDLVKTTFGVAPRPSGDGSTRAIWATASLKPSRKKENAVYWSREDGSPPEVLLPIRKRKRVLPKVLRNLPVGARIRLLKELRKEQRALLPITFPIFVPFWPDTSRNNMYGIWRNCRRVLLRYGGPVSIKRDRRFERGFRYWAMSRGVGHTASQQMVESVIACLLSPLKSRRLTHKAVSVRIGLQRGKTLTPQAVHKDVSYFKNKADGLPFVRPVQGWDEFLKGTNLRKNLVERLRKASTLGDLIRLVEETLARS